MKNISSFDIYKMESLVVTALCSPISSSTSQTTSTLCPLFPQLLGEVRAPGRKICDQLSWGLARMGSYFDKYFKKELQSHRRSPVVPTVSNLIGLNYKTVCVHVNRQRSPPNRLPNCQRPVKKISKRELWSNVASKYEPFIQAR